MILAPALTAMPVHDVLPFVKELAQDLAAKVGVVILTQGTRPADLARGIRSMQAQQGVALDIVVVGNGWEPEGLPDGVREPA